MDYVVAVLAILAFLQSQVAFILAIMAYKSSQSIASAEWVPSQEEQEELDLLSGLDRARSKIQAEQTPQTWEEHRAAFERLTRQ